MQFPLIKIDDLSNALDKLTKAGLNIKSSGEDGVRNIACSPLSGVAIDEIFDVTPYVQAVENHMMDELKNLKFPRKYKIAFSNSLEDTVNAAMTDIGFIAKIVDGLRGFEVYCAGGLGRSPRDGIMFEAFIDHKEVLYYVQAMNEIFEREGEKENRHKARLRIILQRLGEDKFKELFRSELNKVRSERNLTINIEFEKEDISNLKQQTKKSFNEKYENRIINQKQDGFYTVYIHAQSGNMTAENLDAIVNFLEILDYNVSIRLTMTQGLFIRDLKESDAEKLINLTVDFSSIFDINNSVVCAGSKVCNFGIVNSQGLLQQVVEKFENESVELKSALQQIFISGCPNSCSQPQKGIIGFIGKKIIQMMECYQHIHYYLKGNQVLIKQDLEKFLEKFLLRKYLIS